MQMQRDSLEENGVEVTTNPEDDYDIVHLNSIFPSDYRMAKKAKRAGKKVFLYRLQYLGASVSALAYQML